MPSEKAAATGCVIEGGEGLPLGTDGCKNWQRFNTQFHVSGTLKQKIDPSPS